MLFRTQRSRFIVFALIGCVALLTASSLSDARRHASFLMSGNPSGFGSPTGVATTGVPPATRSLLNEGNPRTRLHSPPTELAQERDWLTLISFGGMQGLAQPASISPEHPATLTAQAPDLGRHFRELGIKGSILIYDSKNNRTYEHNPQRNATAFPPASTFKIFNSMVALETGVIADDVAVLTWDGIQREIPEWNHDTNMRQAFKNSTVWFYQVLARRAGHERMQQFINQVGYGNRQIGTAEDIDHFWLDKPLRITPQEQIEFLQRLYQGKPFSQRTINLVKDIMVFEQTPDYKLRAKTGLAGETKPQIGWFVGYLEQNNNVYFFATNIDVRKPEDTSARIEVTRRSFKDLGLL